MTTNGEKTMKRTGIKKLFGFSPMQSLPTYAYNSLCGAIGCWLLTDTMPHFIGAILILEAVLVSLERTWPKGERPC